MRIVAHAVLEARETCCIKIQVCCDFAGSDTQVQDDFRRIRERLYHKVLAKAV